MAPRNSNTKEFRAYKRIQKETNINTKMVYANILDPNQCINNTMNREFEAYKAKKAAETKSTTAGVDSLFKSDKESDKRYRETEWYREKIRNGV